MKRILDFRTIDFNRAIDTYTSPFAKLPLFPLPPPQVRIAMCVGVILTADARARFIDRGVDAAKFELFPEERKRSQCASLCDIAKGREQKGNYGKKFRRGKLTHNLRRMEKIHLVGWGRPIEIAAAPIRQMWLRISYHSRRLQQQLAANQYR